MPPLPADDAIRIADVLDLANAAAPSKLPLLCWGEGGQDVRPGKQNKKSSSKPAASSGSKKIL